MKKSILCVLLAALLTVPAFAVTIEEEAPPLAETVDIVTEPEDAQQPEEAEQPPAEPADEQDEQVPSDAESPADPEPAETPAEEGPAEEQEADVPSDADTPEEEEPLPDSPEEEEETPVIHVTVSPAKKVIVNPYGLEIDLDDSGTTSDQVYGYPVVITSTSSTALSVSVSAVGGFPNDETACLAEAPLAPGTVGKEIFLYMEFLPSADGDSEVPWSGIYTDAANQIAVTERLQHKENVMTIPQADGGAAYGVFRVFGEAALDPDDPWNKAEALSIGLSLSFAPAAGECDGGETSEG